MIKKLLFFFIIFLIVCSNRGVSTHVIASDLTYECLGGLQYKFTLKLYRDCAGIALTNTMKVVSRSTSLGSSTNYFLTRDTFYEVSQVCDSMIQNTRCKGGTVPGVQVHIYSGTYTLSNYASGWEFEFRLCCRSNAISNIFSSFNYYSLITLDNLNGKCNNSPIFNSIPILYSCVGQQLTYNSSPFDSEGDSLSFKLIRTRDSKNVNIPYSNTSFTMASPFSTTSGIMFDTVTGQITFTPNSQSQVILTILITEYDSVGAVKGTQSRDVEFTFFNCPSASSPYISGVDFDTVNYVKEVCYGTPFCFDVYSVSDNLLKPMQLNYVTNLPNSTFTTCCIQ